MASIVCGIIGVMVVEKKLVMMSGGIAHTSYGGIGLGYLLGFEPIIGALLLSILASMGIGYIKRNGKTRTDVVIGLFWSLGMGLGILFIALAPGYPPDLASYLFGSILSVTMLDIYIMAALTLFVVLVVIMLFNYWKSYMFDEEFTHIVGINTAFLEYLLFVLIAMSVIVLIRVVGIILVLALFTAPTATAALFTRGLKTRMMLSVVLGCIFCLAGLAASYFLNTASGASIIVISAVIYGLTSILFKGNRRKTGKKEQDLSGQDLKD